jgi:hypothetical protein
VGEARGEETVIDVSLQYNQGSNSGDQQRCLANHHNDMNVNEEGTMIQHLVM